MGRTKGSKNKPKSELDLDLKEMQQKINELEKVHNSYDQVVDSFTEYFVMSLYNKDIIKRVDNATLQKWFSNPDEYMENITTLLTYYYIINGDIFQLYDLIFTLPPLDYKITVLEKDEKSKEDLKLIKLYIDKKIRHKELTRDLAVQLASNGTILGTWLGNKKEPYFYTFDNLKYIYPYGRYKGKMVGVVDLEWLKDKGEKEKQMIFANLSPLLSQQKYDRYVSETSPEKKEELRYITLPIDKSLVERVHTLNRNQRLGVPFGTQSLFDLQHKQKLKDLETAIANKIIKALAVLKFKGKDDNEVKVSPTEKKKVFNGVKKALEKNNNDDGITVVAIPDFATMDFPSPVENGDKLFENNKYENINNDITSSTGVSPVLNNGTGGNFSSASLNLSILYKKIGVLLEKIEIIYNQLINILLGEERGNNYIFSYNTDEPLKKKDKINILLKLQSQGFSTKSILNELGIDSQEYFDDSFYEIEDLKLRERIIPPKTSYTLSDDGGKPPGDNEGDNEGGNSNPSPAD